MPLAPLHQGECTLRNLRCCVRLRREQYPVDGQQFKSFDRCLFAAFAVFRVSPAQAGARMAAAANLRVEILEAVLILVAGNVGSVGCRLCRLIAGLDCNVWRSIICALVVAKELGAAV